MKVYLCGPINGRSDDDCTWWREQAKQSLTDTLDPMRRDYRGKEASAWREIVELDKIDVASCDVLLVYYDRPSVGTSMEVLYAWERGKRVVVVNKSGARMSPWLVYHAHSVFASLDDALATLIERPPETPSK
jgi:nucleoside 2-deoxyribosyltransferase